jgi:hypothetical protein
MLSKTKVEIVGLRSFVAFFKVNSKEDYNYFIEKDEEYEGDAHWVGEELETYSGLTVVSSFTEFHYDSNLKIYINDKKVDVEGDTIGNSRELKPKEYREGEDYHFVLYETLDTNETFMMDKGFSIERNCWKVNDSTYSDFPILNKDGKRVGCDDWDATTYEYRLDIVDPKKIKY